ncbi:MAG: hypothetical protein L0Y78_06685 [candidate division NC10 bacterium]|nr:hypothetical protein [candidate division NC10 bacterium]
MAKSSPFLQRSAGVLRACERRYDRLRRRLARVDYLAVGTVTVSRLPCGNPDCRCRRGARFRHGPYHYWTTKVAGKTVSKLLKPDEARLYLRWIANRRRLDRTVRAMLEVSRDVAAVLLSRSDAFIPGR